MKSVSIRELRNHGGQVIERVLGGESLTITRSGTPVAQLGPIRRPALDRRTLLERWRTLPPLDPEAFRADVDASIDPSL